MTSSRSYESPTRIIIIDDDEDILNLFSDFLKKEGYGVNSFLDPLKALEEIHRRPQRYSIIITDVGCLEFRYRTDTQNSKINHDIKVIIISAFELNGDDLRNISYISL